MCSSSALTVRVTGVELHRAYLGRSTNAKRSKGLVHHNDPDVSSNPNLQRMTSSDPTNSTSVFKLQSRLTQPAFLERTVCVLGIKVLVGGSDCQNSSNSSNTSNPSNVKGVVLSKNSIIRTLPRFKVIIAVGPFAYD